MAMAISKDNYRKIINELQPKNVTLVAVSKIQPVTAINELYEIGHRDFGENYVQELVEKKEQLPADIRWHFIGHLQTNKVKYIASFVHLIQGVDSLKLLQEINKQAKKNDRIIHVLLQVHIAQEETKFGFDEKELAELLNKIEALQLDAVSIDGLMGMATFTDDLPKVKTEFQYLKNIFNKYASLQTKNCHLQILSMGMSDDFKIAIEEGSTMVRIGSLIFGKRKYA
jgi:PLP dependent protein